MIANIELLGATCSRVHDLWQRVRTSLARLGKQVDEVVDLFRREQRAMRAAMALLSATFALRFLARLARRTAARACCRPVAGRGKVRVARVAAQPLRELGHLLGQLGELLGLGSELLGLGGDLLGLGDDLRVSLGELRVSLGHDGLEKRDPPLDSLFR
jgi:hypothetical protein